MAGIVLQLPLPMHLDAGALLSLIADDKDVDCLKESSVRRCLLRTEPTVSPCISTAVEEVLHSFDLLRSSSSAQRARNATQQQPGRPHVLLVGVPPPLAFPLELCLEAAGCRVTGLRDHEDAAAARAQLHQADVLLIGVRRPDVVAAQWVKNGCLILDLGLCAHIAPAQPTGEGGTTGEGTGCSDAAAEPVEPRDVLYLSCIDGLAAMTAALRMRNASHAALCQQGFLEQDKPPPPLPPLAATSTFGDTLGDTLRNLNPFGGYVPSPTSKKVAGPEATTTDDAGVIHLA